jgi:hypothetical protein
VEFYARRPSILDKPQMDFMFKTKLGTDFRHTHQSETSVGVEFPIQSVAGALFFRSNAEPARDTEWRAGLMLGGAIGESDDTDYFRTVEGLGRQMRLSIRWLQQVEERWCYFEAQARAAGREDRKAEASLRMATAWLDEALLHLKKRTERYIPGEGLLARRVAAGGAAQRGGDGGYPLPGPVPEVERASSRSAWHGAGVPRGAWRPSGWGLKVGTSARPGRRAACVSLAPYRPRRPGRSWISPG